MQEAECESCGVVVRLVSWSCGGVYGCARSTQSGYVVRAGLSRLALAVFCEKMSEIILNVIRDMFPRHWSLAHAVGISGVFVFK